MMTMNMDSSPEIAVLTDDQIDTISGGVFFIPLAVWAAAGVLSGAAIYLGTEYLT